MRLLLLPVCLTLAIAPAVGASAPPSGALESPAPTSKAAKRLLDRLTSRDAPYPSELLRKDVPLRDGRYRHGVTRSKAGYTHLQISAPRIADLDLDGRPEAVVVVREIHCPAADAPCAQQTRVDVWSRRGRRIKRVASHNEGDASNLEGIEAAEGVLVLKRTLCCFDDEGLSRDVSEVWRLTRDGLERVLELPSRPYYPYSPSHGGPPDDTSDATF